VIQACRQLGEAEEVDQVSDILLKWIYWRLATGRKAVTLLVLQLAEKLARRVGFRLSDVEIAVLGGGLRMVLGDNDQDLITAVVRVCSSFRISKFAHKKIAKILVNMLVKGGEYTPRKELVTVIRESCLDCL
jgi:hypothetical protein